MQSPTPFLRALHDSHTHHVLGFYRADAVTVSVTASPNERREVEFFDDGSVEIERFVSTGGVHETSVEALLAELGSAM